MMTVTLVTTTEFAETLEQIAVRAKLGQGQAAPTEAELRAVHQHVGQTIDRQIATEQKDLEAAVVKGLPSGVRLKRLMSQRSAMTVTTQTTLELDDAGLLPSVTLTTKDGKTQKPFAGFTVLRSAERVTVTGRIPSQGKNELHVSSSSRAVSHNAKAVDGGSLKWAGSGVEVKVVFAASQ